MNVMEHALMATVVLYIVLALALFGFVTLYFLFYYRKALYIILSSYQYFSSPENSRGYTGQTQFKMSYRSLFALYKAMSHLADEGLPWTACPKCNAKTHEMKEPFNTREHPSKQGILYIKTCGSCKHESTWTMGPGIWLHVPDVWHEKAEIKNEN